MPTTFLFAALLLQSLASPTLPRWEAITTVNEETVAVDPRSIGRSGNRATLTMRTRVQDPNGLIFAVMRYSYDCAANTVTREAAEMFDLNGRFLGAAGAGDPNQPITAASLHATLRDRACGARG